MGDVVDTGLGTGVGASDGVGDASAEGDGDGEGVSEASGVGRDGDVVAGSSARTGIAPTAANATVTMARPLSRAAVVRCGMDPPLPSPPSTP